MWDAVFFNNLQIYLNDVLLDTITTVPTNWELYSTYAYPIVGINTIIFKGQDDINDKDIALTNIQFYYIQQSGGIAYTSVYNSLKACNIYGTIRSLDYTRGVFLYEGSIFADRFYIYSYKILPTNLNTSLGYSFIYTYFSKTEVLVDLLV